MYRECTLEDILKVIEEKPEQFFDEREELEDLAEEEDTEYYASDDCLLVISPRRRRTEMYAMPLKSDFDLEALEQFAKKKAQNFRLHLNVTGVDAENLRFSEPYEISDPVDSYASEKDNTDDDRKHPVGKIRELTTNDERYTRNFPQRDTAPLMTLQRIFPLLVTDESGTILGYFTPDGTLKGYLSYVPSLTGEFTLDDLYVVKSDRLKGIGSTLAKEFVKRAVRKEKLAYWPVADGEAAKKTAEAAGFKPCARRMIIETF